jgi:DNA-binding SARP family transcriptional activator/ATP/maltotriose-dependent transcriptional regulator MalT
VSANTRLGTRSGRLGVCADYGGGVPRQRLLDVFKKLEVPSVVIAAPAAYGKSCLAAQLAQLPQFSSTIWVRLYRSDDSLESVLCAILDCVADASSATGSGAGLSSPPVSHLVEALVSWMTANSLPDVCLILDDLRAELLPALQDLLAVLAGSQSPVACVVCTTRWTGVEDICVPPGGWLVGPDELLLDDAEVGLLLDGVAGACASSLDRRELVATSGRQVGLLSVLAKWTAAMPSELARPSASSLQLRVLMRSLAESQLDPSQMRTLQCMALLGEGSLDDVAGVRREDMADTEVRAVAATLPLVTLCSDRGRPVFRVHETAQRTFGEPLALCESDAEQLDRVLNTLADRGEEARVLQILLECDDQSRLATWLGRVGRHLVHRGTREILHRSFSRIPPIRVVEDSKLMALKAQLEWESGRGESAQRAARVAREIAENAGDVDALIDALVLLGQVATGNGDFVLARTYAERAVALCPERGREPLVAQLLGRRLLMDALMGNFAGYERAHIEAMHFADRQHQDSEARSLVAFFVATGDVAVRGGWSEMAPVFESASRASRSRVTPRSSALYNYCAALLQTGRTAQAYALLPQLHELAGTGAQGLKELLPMLEFIVDPSVRGTGESAQRVLSAAALAWDSDERLGTVSSLTTCSLAALREGMLEDAVALSERAVAYARETAAPVLVWPAELEHAAALLALGDTSVAQQVASRVREATENTPALTHRLRADLILAEVDLIRGETSLAVQRLSQHADYLKTESANWLVSAYICAFPRLLGAVAAVMGPEGIPAHMLRLIPERRADLALAAAQASLPQGDMSALSRRLLGHECNSEHSSEDRHALSMCRVRLFGGLRVEIDGRHIEDKSWRKRKARLLFAMMSSRCGKDIPRDQLIEYLWPEMDERQALNNFYVAWSCMKQALMPGGTRADTCPYLEHRGGVCRTSLDRVVTDLDEFDALLSLAAKARAARDDAAELAALHSVANLYRGEVLPGEAYDDWFSALRERCRHDFEDAMLRAANLLEARGNLTGGLSLLRRALEHDPWREDLYQAALRLQMATGQRSAAIETYLACRTRLVEDLGIDPSGETMRLYDQVLGMEERAGAGDYDSRDR